MEQAQNQQGVFQKVLVCTDFSESADFAFEYGLKLCRLTPGGRLFLLHVLPENEAQFWNGYIHDVDNVDQKARQDIEERLSKYRRQIPGDLEFQVEVRAGRDHQQILEFAAQADIDLIVIGRSSEHTLQKAFLGDIAEKVCRHAPCAVLVLPLSYGKKHP